jgi:hypothetical protein
MSKTYRKVVAFNDYSRSYTRWSKRQASKAVRRAKDVGNGKHYRMFYNPYNIHDYNFCYYSADEVHSWYKNKIYRVPLKEISPWTYRTYETIRKMT